MSGKGWAAVRSAATKRETRFLGALKALQNRRSRRLTHKAPTWIVKIVLSSAPSLEIKSLPPLSSLYYYSLTCRHDTIPWT